MIPSPQPQETARTAASKWGRPNRLSILLMPLVLLASGGQIPAQESRAPRGAVDALEQVLVDVVARAAPSVVAIARVRQEAAAENAMAPFPRPFGGQLIVPTDPDFIPQEYAAGVVLAPRQVLTTYHSVGDPATSRYVVWSQKRPFPATVLAADPWFDLAVLQLEDGDLTPIALGDGAAAQKGQLVVALGNPQGIARDGEASAAWGMIANLLRRAPRVPERSADPLGRETIHHYGTLLQVDVRWESGFQGGALVNRQGAMIGFLTSLTGGVDEPRPAGLAIPVDDSFRRVVRSLQQGQQPEFGFLGVAPEPLPEALRRRGLHGAVVARVLAGTPAADAGLRSGDLVTHVDQRPVYDDDDLIRLVSVLPPQAVTSLQVLRGEPGAAAGEPIKLDVVLAKKHVAAMRPAVGDPVWPLWRGMRVDYATAVPEFDEYALRIGRFGGVVARDLVEGSPAWQAGLRNGAFISHVFDAAIAHPEQFYRLVAGREGPVELQIIDRQARPEVRTVSP